MQRYHYLLIVCLFVQLGYCNAAPCTDTPEIEHRTLDGRLIQLNREQCRNLPSDDDTFVDCFEADIYDPCDDAGSNIMRYVCYSVHLKVADRRILRAEYELTAHIKDIAIPVEDLKSALASSRTNYEKRIDKFCKERDQQTMDEEGWLPDQVYYDCLIHARDEWARELESFVAEYGKAKDNSKKIRSQGYLLLFLEGRSPLFMR